VETTILQHVKQGADFFVTVNFADPDTKYVKETFKVVEETSQYLIADLREENGK
jgi:hypothetical protein